MEDLYIQNYRILRKLKKILINAEILHVSESEDTILLILSFSLNLSVDSIQIFNVLCGGNRGVNPFIW